MGDVNFQEWIGKREENTDLVSLRQAVGMSVMLDAETIPQIGDPLPPGWHWMFFAEMARQSGLSTDGHAPRGNFLPPVPLPRRMWGGNRLTFHGSIPIGNDLRRESEILSIAEKNGRSGKLALVTVKHCYYGAEGLAIEEEHDIVYRAAATGKNKSPPGQHPADKPDWTKEIIPDSVFLFRYSALTFNGHRIHYDMPYVRNVEGYPGLIVHGPLIATLLMELARENQPAETFQSAIVRAHRPLFSGNKLIVQGLRTDSGVRTWALDSDGLMAMTVEIVFN
jgi:3-methylfumaryl-CoA hydratase